MKKAIVIGANGFLGRNLTKRLALSKIEVLAMVDSRFDYSFLKNKPRIKCLEFEFSQLFSLNNHPTLEGAEIIYCMAWSGVSTTLKNEVEVQTVNILYSLSVMQFAKNNNINKVIMPGSASEYSLGEDAIDGKNNPAPSDMYAASKVATRILCQTYAKQHKIDFIWMIITSVYGPGRNDSNLITYTVKSLLSGECPEFTKLEQLWDYIYIDDLISAFIAVGEKGIGGKSYPVGSGIYCKLSMYITIIHDLINSALPLNIGCLPYKNEKIDNQIMDISELTKDTGFKPCFSFEEGIRKTIAYYKQHNSLK